jgi:hypothetical protein
VVAQQTNPTDESARRKVNRGPLADAIVTPPAHELLDLFGGPSPVDRMHVGEVLGLRVDLGECLEVVRPPLPQEQARRS